MRSSRRFARVGLAAAVLVACAATAAPRTATVLVPAAAARLPAPALAALCARLASPCAPATTRVLVAVAMPKGRLWLIDSARPWLAALDEREPTEASRARLWDFDGYRHSVPAQVDGSGKEEPLIVHPAIYPFGSGGQAVALVTSSREMYSGGGAAFDVADFVELSAAPAAAGPEANVVYAGVPFSCNKIIRACFTEKDYRHSPHCHDESTGHLTIDFGGAASPPGWTFRWHEQDWAGGEPKSKQRWTRSAFSVPAGPRAVARGALSEVASFCGGPVS